MTAPLAVKLPAALVIMAVLTVIAASLAAQDGLPLPGVASYQVTGHALGLGEQQVYLVSRTATLRVSFRDRAGQVQTQTFNDDVSTSVAWTVEGFTAAGQAVLGVATTEPDRARVTAPQPSPMLNEAGVGSAHGVLGLLAPATFLLSSLPEQLPDIGTWWSSKGLLALRYGQLALYMNNVVDQPTGDQEGAVHVSSTGGTDLTATLGVAGLGTTALHGGGGATAQTYLDPQHKLLLGMRLSASNHGNAKTATRHGTYILDVDVVIRLSRYVPGVPAAVQAPGFLLPSAYLGRTSTPDASLYSTAAPELVASPAATDTEFLPPPTSAVTPYPSAQPEVSLAPIPIPAFSGQPVASPPPPPTPQPSPTGLF